MSWLVLTRQERVALLFLTATLLAGCLTLAVQAWLAEPLPAFRVIRGAVPPPDVAPLAPAEEPATVGPAALSIGINTATAADWEALPGIGPATAAAIMAHRETHGRFTSLESLTDVRGIGERTLQRLRPYLLLD